MRLVLFAVTLALSVGAAPVRVGLQTLADQGFSLLLGKRVVVFANPTAVHPSSLLHLVDLLAAHPNITVAGVLAPEHGFRGDLQAEHGDPPSYIDNSTGLRVYSAYRRNGSELAAVLGHLEAQLVISDFQDVGTRLYTFMWTLVDVLGAVQIHGCHMVLLDRPNPLGGITVSGPTLNLTQVPASRYGTVSGITHRHGMTVAELSLYALGQEQPAWLTVYPVTGWSRSMHWADTGLPWIPPSPNLPTPSSAAAYVSTVFLEASSVAEGRGTNTPFELFGAPWVDPSALAATLNRVLGTNNSSTAMFRATFFEPQFFKYNKSVCAGVQYVRHVPAADSFVMSVMLLHTFLEQYPTKFKWDGSWFGWGTNGTLFDLYAGTTRLREMLTAGVPTEQIATAFEIEADQFMLNRKPYLLYR